MSARYAVIGNPVGHSKSPAIHAAFARQTGEDIVYDTLFAERDDFAATASRFFADGGQGLNVTVPFKVDAHRFADWVSPAAQAAGAVNTLVPLADDQRAGHNTDGAGLVRDLEHNIGLSLGGKRLLLLGAGGAARGALAPLLATAPAALIVANRSPQKAEELAHRFAGDGAIDACGLDDLARHAPFDIVINSTSAGLDGGVPALPDALFCASGIGYDMLYAEQATPFQSWARRHGAVQAWDGFGMLVEQAAKSFSLWRGLRPDTEPVIAALRPRV